MSASVIGRTKRTHASGGSGKQPPPPDIDSLDRRPKAHQDVLALHEEMLARTDNNPTKMQRHYIRSACMAKLHIAKMDYDFLAKQGEETEKRTDAYIRLLGYFQRQVEQFYASIELAKALAPAEDVSQPPLFIVNGVAVETLPIEPAQEGWEPVPALAGGAVAADVDTASTGVYDGVGGAQLVCINQIGSSPAPEVTTGAQSGSIHTDPAAPVASTARHGPPRLGRTPPAEGDPDRLDAVRAVLARRRSV